MSTRGWSNFTPEHYMRDEEREDDRRIAERNGFEPDSLLDAWPFIVCGLVAVTAILLWRAGVFA